jgi:hypothetical protein
MLRRFCYAFAGLTLILVLFGLGYRQLAGAVHLTLGSQALSEAQQGRVDRLAVALEQLTQAQSLTPDQPLVYRRIAAAWMLDGKPERAVAALTEAARLAPTSGLIQHELAEAALAADKPLLATRALAQLTGPQLELSLIADAHIRNGALASALELYLELIRLDVPESSVARVRAAIVASALGELELSARLLQEAGAPAELSPGLAGELLSQTDGLFVDGTPLRLEQSQLLIIRGAGWYGPEGAAGRWVRSPAELFVFTPTERSVTLRVLPTMLVDPSSPDGLVSSGTLLVTLNAVDVGSMSAQTGTSSNLTLELSQGWNMLTIALAAGNIRPSEQIQGSLDPRELSVSIAQVEFTTP